MGTGTDYTTDTTNVNLITVVKYIQPIQFTDTSVDATTVLWDFGDDNTSEERNPLHEYTSNGTFFVTLTGYNEFGENSTTQTVTVSGIGTDSYEAEVEGEGEEEVMGCTDSAAINYNSHANTDDGSCIYEIKGCTDSDAKNYNPNANTDDGSCEYDDDPDLGDTDTTDLWDDDSDLGDTDTTDLGDDDDKDGKDEEETPPVIPPVIPPTPPEEEVQTIEVAGQLKLTSQNKWHVVNSSISSNMLFSNIIPSSTSIKIIWNGQVFGRIITFAELPMIDINEPIHEAKTNDSAEFSLTINPY